MSGKGKRRRIRERACTAVAAINALPDEMLEMMADADGTIRVELLPDGGVRVGPGEPQLWSSHQYAEAPPLEYDYGREARAAWPQFTRSSDWYTLNR